MPSLSSANPLALITKMPALSAICGYWHTSCIQRWCDSRAAFCCPLLIHVTCIGTTFRVNRKRNSQDESRGGRGSIANLAFHRVGCSGNHCCPLLGPRFDHPNCPRIFLVLAIAAGPASHAQDRRARYC